jgi:hypothetical protein
VRNILRVVKIVLIPHKLYKILLNYKLSKQILLEAKLRRLYVRKMNYYIYWHIFCNVH